MTHLYLAELNSRGREVAPCLNGSSMMFYQVCVSVCVQGPSRGHAGTHACSTLLHDW